MSIQRYEMGRHPYDSDISMIFDEHGNFVRYTDHAAEIARLRAELEQARAERDKAVKRRDFAVSGEENLRYLKQLWEQECGYYRAKWWEADQANDRSRRTIAALADRGDIPKHAEWDQWDLPPPVDFTVDANKDRQTDLTMVEAGFSSNPAVIRKLGYSQPRELMLEQAEYLADQQEIAAEVSKRRGVVIRPEQLGNPQRNPAAQANQATTQAA